MFVDKSEKIQTIPDTDTKAAIFLKATVYSHKTLFVFKLAF
jgi:hypothetical protein